MWHTVTWDLPKWGSGLTFRREEGERMIFMKCIQGKGNKKHQGCFCLACVPQTFNSLKLFASLRIMQVLIYICGNIAQGMSIHPQSWSPLTEPDAFPINYSASDFVMAKLIQTWKTAAKSAVRPDRGMRLQDKGERSTRVSTGRSFRVPLVVCRVGRGLDKVCLQAQ